MFEVVFNDLDYQYDIFNSRLKLIDWYAEELKLNPKLEHSIRKNYRKLSLNLGEKPRITSIRG